MANVYILLFHVRKCPNAGQRDLHKGTSKLNLRSTVLHLPCKIGAKLFARLKQFFKIKSEKVENTTCLIKGVYSRLQWSKSRFTINESVLRIERDQACMERWDSSKCFDRKKA